MILILTKISFLSVYLAFCLTDVLFSLADVKFGSHKRHPLKGKKEKSLLVTFVLQIREKPIKRTTTIMKTLNKLAVTKNFNIIFKN